jgi:hypothetical protein
VLFPNSPDQAVYLIKPVVISLSRSLALNILLSSICQSTDVFLVVIAGVPFYQLFRDCERADIRIQKSFH